MPGICVQELFFLTKSLAASFTALHVTLEPFRETAGVHFPADYQHSLLFGYPGDRGVP